MHQMSKQFGSRTDTEKLAIALHTQELMHQKIGALRKQINALVGKNKLLRRKVLKLQQHINKLNESFF